MLFQPTRRWSGFKPTKRKEAAFSRKQERQRAALPLFACEIAKTQHSFEEDLHRREWQHKQSDQSRRSMIARHWMQARARRQALPAWMRAEIDDQWRRWTGPRTSACLGYLIQSLAAKCRVRADDFPHVTMADRRRLTADLDRHAMLQVRHWHSQRMYSPGALRFLSPFFEEAQERSAPRLYLDTNLAQLGILDQAIAAQSFREQGDTRTGSFAIENTAFHYEIRFYRPRSNERSPAPWNFDFAHRILWVGRAGEKPPRNFAQALSSPPT